MTCLQRMKASTHVLPSMIMERHLPQLHSSVQVCIKHDDYENGNDYIDEDYNDVTAHNVKGMNSFGVVFC